MPTAVYRNPLRPRADLVQIHPEAEAYHGSLQEIFRHFETRRIGMGGNSAEDQPGDQGQRRGGPRCQTKRQTEDK